MPYGIASLLGADNNTIHLERCEDVDPSRKNGGSGHGVKNRIE
jgi:hypothetical protein